MAYATFVLAAVAYGCRPEAGPGDAHLVTVLDVVAAPSGHEAGFVEIPPLTYSRRGKRFRSTSARLFYSYVPASALGTAPRMFVIFNGPGASTGLLRALGTGARRLDLDDLETPRLVDTEASWSTMGALLYIDSRQAGVSYDMLPYADDLSARAKAFSPANFNEHLDAADVLRVVIAVRGRLDAVRAARLVLMGESYGGVRAQRMIQMIRRPDALESPTSTCGDPALAALVRAGFPAEIGAPVPSRVIEGQVLIQPLIAGAKQWEVAAELSARPDSAVVEVARSLGMDPGCTNDACRVSAGQLPRSQSHLLQPSDWSLRVSEAVTRVMTEDGLRRSLFGTDLRRLEALWPSGRQGAFRVADPAKALPPLDPVGMRQVHGELPAHDRYFVYMNMEARVTFEEPLGETTEVFLENLRGVPTLITDARYDGLIVSAAIPVALAGSADVVSVSADRSGDLHGFAVTYRQDGARRFFAMPRYMSSGHTVTASQPDDLLEDVRRFFGF